MTFYNSFQNLHLYISKINKDHAAFSYIACRLVPSGLVCNCFNYALLAEVIIHRHAVHGLVIMYKACWLIKDAKIIKVVGD